MKISVSGRTSPDYARIIITFIAGPVNAIMNIMCPPNNSKRPQDIQQIDTFRFSRDMTAKKVLKIIFHLHCVAKTVLRDGLHQPREILQRSSHISVSNPNHPYGLYEAIKRGDLDIIKEILSFVRLDNIPYYSVSENIGLSGSREVVEFLTTLDHYNTSHDAGVEFVNALKTGNLEFINYCWSRLQLEPPCTTITDHFRLNPQNVYFAIIGGCPDIIEKALPYGNVKAGLCGALISNRSNWIDYFCEKGAMIDERCIVGAIRSGNLDFVQKHLPSVGLTSRMISWAVNHVDILRYLVTSYRDKIDFRDIINIAIRNYNWDAFEY